jgi:hypothetical protein
MASTVVATSGVGRPFPRCADGEHRTAGTVRQVGWAIWLLAPAGATVLAALGSWWRSRPKRPLTTDEAMRAHGEYLDALVRTARARDPR